MLGLYGLGGFHRILGGILYTIIAVEDIQAIGFAFSSSFRSGLLFLLHKLYFLVGFVYWFSTLVLNHFTLLLRPNKLTKFILAGTG